jgi:cation diffusion facilitator family transporter
MLFIVKIIVAFLSNSLALLSDAFNSLTDIVSYTGIYIAVKISNKKADHDHPFGHHRAEPIAGLIVSVFAIFLGYEVLKNAIISFLSPREFAYEFLAIIVLVFTMITKTFMSKYFTGIGEKENRPALKAAGVDSRNDVLVSGVALAGVIGPWVGLQLLDSAAAIVISLFIFYSAYKIGRENIDYLMGKSPPKQLIKAIRVKTLNIKGVKGINELRAHYVGNSIHVELHIEVDRNTSTEISHNIGKKVERAVEKIENIEKAFIHIDPK